MNNIEPTIPAVPPVKKVAKVETVTLKHLAMALAERHDLNPALHALPLLA